MAKRITKIEKQIISIQKFNARTRVAAYARVSTNKAEQEMSLEAQIDYFEKYVENHPGWELVEIYYDNGVSGTSEKRREGFKKMLADCESGYIDRIVTKSISRFARNTVDTINTIRHLKTTGIGIYFQKEDIWTLDGKSEFILTLMASFAQEESRSISENVAWGQRKRFADGQYWVGYSLFLGYDKGPEGNFVVNQEQAQIIKRIYHRFLLGLTPHSITLDLMKDGILSPSKGERWHESTVKSILQNVKYKGDALMQIGFTEDFLTKKAVKNTGQLPQYYVTGGHEAIISPEIFDYVQEIICERKHIPSRGYSGIDYLHGKFRCGRCNAIFGPKPLHSNDKYRYILWQCRNRFRKGSPCRNRHIRDKEMVPLLRHILFEMLKQQAGLRDKLTSEISKVVQDVERMRIIEKGIEQFENSAPDIAMEEWAMMIEKITVLDENLTVEAFGGLIYNVKWPISVYYKQYMQKKDSVRTD